MARRTALLITAILVAALGTVLVMVYVHNVDKRALAKQQPVEVLIAKKLIPAGTTGAAAAAAGDLERTTIPRDALASGGTVLSDITAVSNRIALAPIYPGEQILAEKFGKPGDSNALSIPDPGTIAVSVSLTDPARVDGFVVPGSHVTVFLTVKNSTQVLLKDAKVIAIGTRTLVPSSGQNAAQAQSDVVTFGVTQADALKLISAQSTGALYLGLLGNNSSAASDTSTASSNS
jgi:pilus assembly protein CpaB